MLSLMPIIYMRYLIGALFLGLLYSCNGIEEEPSADIINSVCQTGLPILLIDTPMAKEIPAKDKDWLAGTTLRVYDEAMELKYMGQMGIRGRGNNTWKYPKKPYALKLDEQAELLGMPSHKRWVLLANWVDRTMLRNHIAFEISRRTSLYYTPRGKFVEVILNGEHIGCYYLCEQIMIDKNRLDIYECNEEQVNRGYLLELDKYYDEKFKFHSPLRGLPYMFKTPDSVTEKQYAFIYDYISKFENILYDDVSFLNREYVNYIDIDSFVDWWIVVELTGIWEPNHPKSTYMHKDKDGRLAAGPVWDFDYDTFTHKSGFRCQNAIYYDRLFQDAEFVSRVKERWLTLRDDLASIPDYIEAEAAKLQKSDEFNHYKWPITIIVNNDEHMTYSEAVENMKKAYQNKYNFLNNEILRM